MSLWHSFLANLGDAVKANLRAGGDGSTARREFRQLRDKRLAAERTVQVLGQYAIAAYERSEAQKRTGPWEDQYYNDDVHMKVKNGWSADRKCWTTEVLVCPRDGDGSHLHVVIDENGNEIYRGWRKK